MLRILLTSLLTAVLMGCIPERNNSHDKPNPIFLEGSNPDGFTLSFSAEKGYHALNLNGTSWNIISHKVIIEKLDDSDSITIASLCEDNGLGEISTSTAQAFRSAYTDSETISRNCYDQSDFNDETEKNLTLVSQQALEGIKLVSVSFPYYGTQFLNTDGQISGPDLKENEGTTIVVTAYNSSSNMLHIYRDDTFSFTNGDIITIDFWSDNVEQTTVDRLSESEGKTYNYSRYYLEKENSLYIDTGIPDLNRSNFTMPESISSNSAVYREIWGKKLLEGDLPSINFFEVISKQPNSYITLETIASQIQGLNLTFTDSELGVTPPTFKDLETNYWSSETVIQYDNFIISHSK